jgi:hypothetical protein
VLGTKIMTSPTHVPSYLGGAFPDGSLPQGGPVPKSMYQSSAERASRATEPAEVSSEQTDKVAVA